MLRHPDAPVTPDAPGPEASAPAAAAADPSGSILDTGGTWRDELPAELRGHQALADFKDIGGLASSFIATQAMTGAKELTVPTKDSTPEQREAFFQAIGRPDKPSDYELPQDGLPEGVNLEAAKEGLQEWFEEFHEIGMTKAQAASVVRKLTHAQHSRREEQFEEMERMKEASTRTLQREFGEAYDENLELAKSTATRYWPNLDFGKIANNAEFIKGLAQAGRELGQDEVLGSGRKVEFAVQPGEAKSQITELSADKDFIAALGDPTNENHAEANARWMKLHQAASAGQ